MSSAPWELALGTQSSTDARPDFSRERAPPLHRVAEPQVEHRELLLGVGPEPEDGVRLVQVVELGAGPHDASLAERPVVEGGVEGAEVEVGGADDVPEEQACGEEVLV